MSSPAGAQGRGSPVFCSSMLSFGDASTERDIFPNYSISLRDGKGVERLRVPNGRREEHSSFFGLPTKATLARETKSPSGSGAGVLLQSIKPPTGKNAVLVEASSDTIRRPEIRLRDSVEAALEIMAKPRMTDAEKAFLHAMRAFAFAFLEAFFRSTKNMTATERTIHMQSQRWALQLWALLKSRRLETAYEEGLLRGFGGRHVNAVYATESKSNMNMMKNERGPRSYFGKRVSPLPRWYWPLNQSKAFTFARDFVIAIMRFRPKNLKKLLDKSTVLMESTSDEMKMLNRSSDAEIKQFQEVISLFFQNVAVVEDEYDIRVATPFIVGMRKIWDMFSKPSLSQDEIQRALHQIESTEYLSDTLEKHQKLTGMLGSEEAISVGGCNFASFLYKKGGRGGGGRNWMKGGRRNWKRRWFVLRSYNLAYYSTMNDKDPLWEGVAVSYERMGDEKDDSGRFRFRILCTDRELTVAADTAAELRIWLDQLDNSLARSPFRGRTLSRKAIVINSAKSTAKNNTQSCSQIPEEGNEESEGAKQVRVESPLVRATAVRVANDSSKQDMQELVETDSKKNEAEELVRPLIALVEENNETNVRIEGDQGSVHKTESFDNKEKSPSSEVVPNAENGADQEIAMKTSTSFDNLEEVKTTSSASLLSSPRNFLGFFRAALEEEREREKVASEEGLLSKPSKEAATSRFEYPEANFDGEADESESKDQGARGQKTERSITNNQGARRRSVGIDLGIVDQDAGIHKISEMQEKAAVLSAQLRSQSLPGSDMIARIKSTAQFAAIQTPEWMNVRNQLRRVQREEEDESESKKEKPIELSEELRRKLQKWRERID